MFPVSSGPETLAADKVVIEQCGIPSIVLMEKAADAVVFAMRYSFPDFSNKKFAIICGSGNNGADGVAIARNLLSRFAQVDVFLVSREIGFNFKSEEGKTNLRILLDENFMKGLKVVEWNMETSAPNLGIYDGVVDALFGAGFNSSKPIDNFYKQVISNMNTAKFIVSVDIPSGQCPTTGQSVEGSILKSTITVTFGIIKSGLVTYPGKSNCGKIYFSPISYPQKILRSSSSQLIVPLPLLPRNPDGHKCSFGRGLFVSGCRSYMGAPFFCSASFLRCGGGYSKLYSLDKEVVYPVVASHMSEIVFMQEITNQVVANNDVIVIGPGLGKSEQAVDLVRSVLTILADTTASSVSGLIIDGDGLNVLLTAFEDNRAVWKMFSRIMKSGTPIILTPHLGELKRLLWPPSDTSSSLPHSVCLPPAAPHFMDYVASTKLVCDELIAELSNLIIVVKGSTTCVVKGHETVRINVTGNSGMGTAGTGDVLCGVIANIVSRARKTEIIDSVSTGVWIHGRAGDLAKERLGEDGIIASDLLKFLPEAVKEVSENATYKWKSYYPVIV